MTSLTYEFYLQRENYYDCVELTFDFVGACEHESLLGHAVIQSGDTGMMRSMINSAIAKIKAFRNVKEEETNKVVDMVINTLEAIPLAVQDLASAQSSTQIIGALLRAYKMFTRSNIITSAADLSQRIFDKIKETSFVTYMKEYGTSVNVAPVVQGGDFQWMVEGARSLLTSYKGLKDCALVHKLQDVLQYLLSFGIFESLGLTFDKCRYSEFEARRVKSEHKTIEGFIFSILESVVWLLERGMQAVELGSFQPFFHSSADYSAWVGKSYRILEDSIKIDIAPSLRCEEELRHTPEEKLVCLECKRTAGLDEHEFLARLETTLEEGEAMAKYATDPSDKLQIQKMLRELRITEARFLSKDKAQRGRKPPFTLLVSGKPKVAKTMFMDICFMQYAKVHKKDERAECKWVRQSLDKFYSGYKPWKWCIVLDDVAMYAPNATPLDPSVADIIMLANGVPLVAPMAEATQKGIYSVRPDLLLASTNTDHLNAHCYFSCPQAVRRRFPYVVDLTIKDEYKGRDDMVEPSKIPFVNGEYQNIWHINLKKLMVVPSEGGTPSVELKTVAIFEEIDDFLVMFSKLTNEHVLNEDRAQVACEDMRKIQICDRCYRNVSKCGCIQSGSVSSTDAEVPAPFEINEDFTDDAYARYLRDPTLEGFERFMLGARKHFATPNVSDIPLYLHSIDNLQTRSTDESDYDSDTESFFSECVEESLYNDQRSAVTKAMDLLDDTLGLARAAAAVLAYKVGNVTWNIADTVMAQASDLVVLYQVKKYTEMMKNIGQKIYDRCFNWKVAGFCALLLAIWATWKSCSYIMTNFFSDSSEVQTQAEVTEGVRPTFFVKDEKPNPWIKEEILLSSFQVPSKSKGWSNLSIQQVKDLISPNVVNIKMEYETKNGFEHYPATAFCITGHIYMTNNHCIPDRDTMTCHLSQEPSTPNIGKNVTFTVTRKMIYRIPERDIAFFWCMLPPKMDATELFLKEHVSGLVCNGFYTHCRSNAYAHTNDVRAIKPEINTVPLAKPTTMTVHYGAANEETIFGDCGSPLVGFTPLGPVILGIHQQLYRGKTGANQVLSKDIESALSYFGPQVQCGVPNLEDSLGPLHIKSVLHWPNSGRGHVYGSTAKSSWRSAPKSSVVPTYISEEAQKEGFVKRCGKPAMKGAKVWFNNIEPTVSRVCKFDKGRLDDCVDSFTKDILGALDAETLAELVKLDDKTTLNGFPGLQFIDKVKRSTSMGYPYRKPKTQYLVPCEPDDIWSDAVEYKDEIMEEVRLIREVYSRNERYMPVFVMSLKDEPTPYAKIAIEKTRGFMGGPAAWQFVYRQQLLTFVRVFQQNTYVFEGAPGMNCNSCAWDHLNSYLTQFGEDRIVGGDYKQYDKGMEPMFILAAFDLIINVLKAAGRSEKDLMTIRCMANDVAYPLTDVQGDFIEFFGSNPSGHALTVIINCIVNSLYMRYCYSLLHPRGRIGEFKQDVALMTYGDDNIMGVSKKAPWFNHGSIAEKLQEFGVVYTMADKTSESRPYINISEASFLKREFKFVVDHLPNGEKVNRRMCPLEWASIDKMLTMCVKSKSVNPEEQSIQAIRSAVGEFYQYGREAFELNVAKMKRIVSKCDLDSYVTSSTFPSYDELLESYAESQMNCSAHRYAFEALRHKK